MDDELSQFNLAMERIATDHSLPARTRLSRFSETIGIVKHVQ